MKNVIKSIFVGFLCALIFSVVPFEARCREISNQVFRIHILANSDSDEDQSLKLKVRDAVIASSEELLSQVHSKEDAIRVIENNLDYLKKVAQEVIFLSGYEYPVSLEIRNLCFDTRYYGNITMPGGFYDALQIRIGEAKGKNWWCVMYPSLCIFSASKTDRVEEKLTDDQYRIVSSEEGFELRFKVVELFNSFCNLFRNDKSGK